MSTKSHESPVKQIRTMGSIGSGTVLENSSPFMHWAASPLYQFDCFSPDASNMSFTMTSPPCKFQSFDSEAAQQSDNISSAISPSIFSPKDRPMSKHPKKRDLYQESSNNSRGGIIAGFTDKISSESRCESRSSLDLPHASTLLDSPHFSLWGSVQSTMEKNRNDLFVPPTPASMGVGSCLSSSSKSADGHSRMWSQGIAGDADEDDLFAATSHVMRMGASPLIGGDFLGHHSSSRPGSMGLKSSSKYKQSPDSAYSMDVDDSNESYELETLHKKDAMGTAAASSSSRRKKPFVSPDSSSAATESSVGIHSVGSISSAGTLLSPHEGSASVEKLSVAVKNQKFGVSSLMKPGSVGSSVATSGRRLLKPQHSLLEKSDLSQYFGTQRADEATGEESNGSATKTALVLNTAEITVCNCKKSKCLKLYCDCFAVMNYCSGGCNCYDCSNTVEREHIRLEAIRATKERNASAFLTKINERDQHSTGCHCKNSQCLKKYCECYTGGAFCGQNCKCLSCLNYSGSVELVKARTSAKDGDGPGSSRKRKESPSSVAFLDATPPADPSKLLIPSKLLAQQAVHLSPDLVGPTKTSGRLAGAAALRAQAIVATPVTGISSVLVDRSLVPHNFAIESSANNHYAHVDMQQPGIKRSKVQTPAQIHSTPVDATLAGRQLRSRKGASQDEEPSGYSSSVKLEFRPTAHSTLPAQRSQPASVPTKIEKNQPVAAPQSHKKRQVKFAPIVYEYPFFGAELPKTSKLIALKCLDFLEGKDIYAMSQVNSLWNSAAMDDALWE